MSTTLKIPKDSGIDNTINLLNEGYLFVKNRMDIFKTDIFQTHLMGRKFICISGKEAAEIFYNQKLFERKGVLPKRVQKTLFGKNAIQGMDGAAHNKRKLLFMEIMSEERAEKFGNYVKRELIDSIPRLEEMNDVVLFDEVSETLCYVACNWVGIQINKREASIKAKDFISMIYSFGSMGLKYHKGKRARKRTEEWIEGIVKKVREGKLKVKSDTPLYQVSFYKDIDNKLLDSRMAAIEIINIIRPIVAISTYIVFGALALWGNQECKQKLINNEDNYLEMFVQEVRRFYPFAPFVGARVKSDFIWNRYKLKKGSIVLLDIYGMNHDSRIWDKPYVFNPDRFKDHKENLFDFIPQGGGKPEKGHRCPGEVIVVKVMEVTLNFLIKDIQFNVKNQDLSYSLKMIPTLPCIGFVMNDIKGNTNRY